MRTRYSEKLLKGEQPTPAEWVDHLRAAHRAGPSMTPKAFQNFKTDMDINSYQLLADTIREIEPQSVLDLGCGDGHLIPYIQKIANAKLVGIDMSAEELKIAIGKNLGSGVSFKCEMADRISEASGSFDAIVSHMAFMLMNPVAPVVQEISRLLRPGGLFAAVVSNQPSPSGFYGTYRRVLREFIKRKYTSLGEATVGDPLLEAKDGLSRIFPPSDFRDGRIQNFELHAKLKTADVWSFFKDMYLVTALPEGGQRELSERIIDAATAAAVQGQVLLDFPLKLITVYKS